MKYALLVLSMMSQLAIAASTDPKIVHHWGVYFYDISSTHAGLDQTACLAMNKPFTFDTIGDEHQFNLKDNPNYTNYTPVIALPLDSNQYLQVNTVVTNFTYGGKKYQIPSHIFCQATMNPFGAHCVFYNQYCKAAFILVEDNPNHILPPELMSIPSLDTKIKTS